MVRQLGDVDQALHALGDLDEGPEGDQLGHAALDLLADLDPLDDLLPRVLPGLLEAERDALAVAVDLKDLDLYLLADLDDLARMVDMLPTEFRDVNQAVYPFEIDEGPEVNEVGDGATDDHALLQGGQDALALLLALLLEDGAPGKDDVIAAPVQLDDLALELLAEEGVEVPHAPDVDEARRQEAAQPDVQDQATLHDLDDERLEVLTQLDHVVRVGALADGQLVRGDQPLRFVADVDEYLVAVYADDVA